MIVNIRALLMSLSALLLCAPVIAWSRFDYVNGGHGWRQGDWLVNFGAGPVRRGLIGEFLIFLSDTSGVNLLVTTLIVQVIIFATVAFVLWRIAIRHPAPALLLLLVASPAFFLIFFAANPMGSMRKELFGVLAMGLLTLCGIRRKQGLFLPVLAIFAYTIGCIGTILHLFMLPAVLASLHLLHAQGILSRAAVRWLAGVSIAMALFWFAFALRYNEITNLADICAPLLERGLDMEICNHAIRWLVSGEIDHFGQVLQRLTFMSLVEYGALALLCLAPLVICFSLIAERRYLMFVLAICFFPLLPLYATATDWGRWLCLSYTMSALLLLHGTASGRLTLIRQPNTYLVTALLCASLLLTPEHSIGWKPDGALVTIVETIGVFL